MSIYINGSALSSDNAAVVIDALAFDVDWAQYPRRSRVAMMRLLGRRLAR